MLLRVYTTETPSNHPQRWPQPHSLVTRTLTKQETQRVFLWALEGGLKTTLFREAVYQMRLVRVSSSSPRLNLTFLQNDIKWQSSCLLITDLLNLKVSKRVHFPYFSPLQMTVTVHEKFQCFKTTIVPFITINLEFIKTYYKHSNKASQKLGCKLPWYRKEEVQMASTPCL